MTSEYVDGLVREYLLYRGFSNSLKTFDSELKSDRDKGLRPDKITEQLMAYVSASDIQGLRDYWNHLDCKLFCRLEQIYSTAIRKLEFGLLKFYLVQAHQAGRQEKIAEFFEKLTPELQKVHEWRDWFAFPFVKNPEENAAFSVYFSKSWQDTYAASLHNFISVVVKFAPTPKLMQAEVDLFKLKSAVGESEKLKNQLRGNGSSTKELDLDLAEEAKDEAFLGRDLTGADLMDDFAVISQEHSSLSTSEGEPNSGSSQTKTIKSFIRTITLPSSPNPSTSSKKSTHQSNNVKTERKISSPAGPVKSASGKPRSSSIPAESVITQQVRPILTNATLPQALPIEEVPASSEEATPTTPVVSPMPSAESSSSSKVCTPLPSPPFLLLSQEDYKEHPSSIAHVRFSPTGSHVASVDVDGVIKVWSSRAATTRATIMSKAVMTCVDWVPTGDRLLLHGNRAAAVRLFDLKENKSVSESSLDSSFPRVNCVSCDPKAAFFLVASTSRGRTPSSSANADPSVARSGILQLLDLRTFKKVLDLPVKSGPAHVNCIKWNSSGSRCLTGGSDGVLRLFDLQQKDCVAQWQAQQGEIHTVDFTKDERGCYSMGAGGSSSITQWTLDGAKTAELSLHSGAGGPFVLSGFGGLKQVHTPKGGLFALDSDKKFCLTCKMSGALLYKFESDPNPAAKPQMAIGGHKSPVVTVDWSTVGDCSICATASMDGTIKISTLLSQTSS